MNNIEFGLLVVVILIIVIGSLAEMNNFERNAGNFVCASHNQGAFVKFYYGDTQYSGGQIWSVECGNELPQTTVRIGTKR